MTVEIKYTRKDAKITEYALRNYFNSQKASMEKLIKMAVWVIVNDQLQTEAANAVAAIDDE